MAKVVTGKVRFSYAHLFKPYAGEDGQDPKYSVSIIIPKSDKATIAAIQKAVEEAFNEGISSKFGGKKPIGAHMPLRDGDTEKSDPAYKDSYFINCTSKNKPSIVDRNKVEILDPSEIKSGDYGRVSVNFYPYNTKGNKGVACGLNGVQFIQKGEPLGSFNDPMVDFADDLPDELMDF